MYLLPNQRLEGSYLKILSAKRISLLRVNISDHCLLFRKAIIKQLQARHPGDLSVGGRRCQDSSDRRGLGPWLHLLLLKPRVILSWSLHLSAPHSTHLQYGNKDSHQLMEKINRKQIFQPMSLGVPRGILRLDAKASTRVRVVPEHGFLCLTQPLHLLLSHSLWVADKDRGQKGRFLERGGGWAGPAWLVSLTAEGAGRMTRTSEEAVSRPCYAGEK